MASGVCSAWAVENTAHKQSIWGSLTQTGHAISTKIVIKFDTSYIGTHQKKCYSRMLRSYNQIHRESTTLLR